MLGGEDFLIVVIIALVIFGAGQLPKIARNLGEAQKELKRAMRDDDDAVPAPAAPTTAAASAPAAAPAASTDTAATRPSPPPGGSGETGSGPSTH
ncbi:MAG: twin-arginine translocase TatA/TatE family subunit [Actinobacteria bacterium]|nr:twin-arginine translocase TatA/TatE family subunit [Actinomycetota bacterium]